MFWRLLSLTLFALPLAVVGIAGVQIPTRLAASEERGLEELSRFLLELPLGLALYASVVALLGNSLSYLAPTISTWSVTPRRVEADHIRATRNAKPSHGELAVAHVRNISAKGRELRLDAEATIAKRWNERGLQMRMLAAFSTVLVAAVSMAAAFAFDQN